MTRPLLVVQIAPSHEGLELGVGDSILIKVPELPFQLICAEASQHAMQLQQPAAGHVGWPMKIDKRLAGPFALLTCAELSSACSILHVDVTVHAQELPV